MADVVFVLVTVAFFAVAALVLRGVEKLLSVENVAGLIVSAVLLVYLFIALLFPERF